MSRSSALAALCIVCPILLTPAAGQAQEAAAPPAVTAAAAPVASSPARPSEIGAPLPPSTGAADRPLPHDLSVWSMFMQADWVVKSVMAGLVLASLATWTIWLAKSIELKAAGRNVRRALRIVSSAGDLNEAARALAGRGDPAALLLAAANEEMGLLGHADGAARAGTEGRVASRLSRIEAGAGRRMARGTGILATIGSTAPFVGLFGTVWGIMNAFIGISHSQTTNLAVVAPGIAEALLATAFGLVAAIPAVVIYNVFARSIAGYRHGLADVSASVERLVSREFDRRHLRPRLREAAE